MSGPIVLVIEDNPPARRMLEVALGGAGFTVHAAPDAKSALTLFEATKPALVLQDLVLPDMDGFELARALRASPRGAEVPIIACSGFLPGDDRARIAAAGFDDFLVKPIEPSRLVEIVRQYLPDAAPSGPPPAPGRCVLIVDDDAIQRKLLAVHLERKGFTVIATENGEEALDKAAAHRPDAIASDVLMPGLNGFGLCLALRRDPDFERLPVVLFSANYLESEDCQVAKSVGATAFVVRQPDFCDVIDVLEACLEKRKPPATPPRPRPGTETPTGVPRNRILQHLDKQATLNAQLVRDCTIQAAGLSILGSVSDALARSEDLDRALAEALAVCVEAGGVTAGAVFTIDANHALVTRAETGFDAAAKKKLDELVASPSFLARILASEAPVALPRGIHPGEESLFEAGVLASALVAPLVLRGERLGALVLASKDRDLGGADWIAFARPVAAQIALALALARTFERLRASESWHRGLMEHANDAVIVLDPARGVVLDVNRRAEKLLGRPAEDIVGTRLDVMRPVLDGTGARLVDLEIVGANGQTTHVDVSAAKVDLGEKRVVIAIARDVSERIEAQEEQIRLHGEASRAARARDAIPGLIATELGEPLERLARALDGAVAENREAGPSLVPARRQLKRLRQLVDLVALAARAPRAEIRFETAHVDLATIVCEVAGRFSEELEEAGSPLDVRAETAVVGHWDRERLEQIVTVLIANALRHGAGKPIVVAVEGSATEGRVIVADGGAGVAAPGPLETLEHRDGTTSMGLWVARRIVEAAGGGILVATRPGAGSVVRVTFPRR